MSAGEAEDRQRTERALDRIEERLHAAPPGFHAAGQPASPEALAAAKLPGAAAMVWQAFDGIELAMGEVRLFALSELEAATSAADAEGILRAGDRVIAERGRETYVLPEDPWEEGAEVVVVGDDVERAPEASTVAHWVLGVLGELSILYDAEGEFADGLFDEDGELTSASRRRLSRRRLDLDPDAPRARLALARTLLEAGEQRAAGREITQVLRRAPQWPWALYEQGRVHEALGRAGPAVRAYEKAAEEARDVVLKAHFLAHAAAGASDESERERLAAAVTALRPDYVANQLQGARAQLAREATHAAAPLLRLGLAISPRNLELLALQQLLE